MYFVAIASSVATAADSQPTLKGGTFGDERLILGVNPDSDTLSGYYNDGACRVFFIGKLQPITQELRPGMGETYQVQSWDPRRPAEVFTTTLYSQARGGFDDQVTLERGPDAPNRPSACRWRISLDRTEWAGNQRIGAAVIARSRPQLFKLVQAGEALRLLPMSRAALDRDSGVWINKTYGQVPRGMLAINWYYPRGKPSVGYVRERDLYPMRLAQTADTSDLSCMILRDGTFEQLGYCASINLDGSYTIAENTLKSLDFDRWGLATVVIGKKGYAYVRRDGRALVVPTFDNAPDEFIDGLARVRIGEKLGYANRRLKLVIPAVYDGAYRFAENGRAWACVGCVSVSDGDHSFYKDGIALCLDTRGRKRLDAECSNAGWLPDQLRE